MCDPYCEVTEWMVLVALEGICMWLATTFVFSMCGFECGNM
jgi:hypothetical protein